MVVLVVGLFLFCLYFFGEDYFPFGFDFDSLSVFLVLDYALVG